MYRFTSWARAFIFVFFCVDYNSADDRDKELQRLIKLVDNWPITQTHVISNVRLKANQSRIHPYTLNVFERTNPQISDDRHYRFYFSQPGRSTAQFYDFQINTFVHYFEKNLRFMVREGGRRTITLSVVFPSEEDVRYLYSKALTIGNVSRGFPFDPTVFTGLSTVETFERNTSTVKSSFSRVDITYSYSGGTRVFNLSSYANAEATIAEIPVLIFSTDEFNIGHQTMDKKVMLYLVDHRDTIIVVTLPTTEAANIFYDTIKRECVDNVTQMLTVDEMQKYDR